MKRVIAALAGATMMLAAGVASAADAKGAVTAVNAAGRTAVIGGVTYTFPAAVDMAIVTVGATVNVTFATAGTVNTVSKVTK